MPLLKTVHLQMPVRSARSCPTTAVDRKRRRDVLEAEDEIFCTIMSRVAYAHVVAPSINGANGEATGSDDLDAARNDEAKRNHKSAALRVHNQRPTSQERSRPDDMTERKPGNKKPQLTFAERAKNLAECQRLKLLRDESTKQKVDDAAAKEEALKTTASPPTQKEIKKEAAVKRDADEERHWTELLLEFRETRTSGQQSTEKFNVPTSKCTMDAVQEAVGKSNLVKSSEAPTSTPKEFVPDYTLAYDRLFVKVDPAILKNPSFVSRCCDFTVNAATTAATVALTASIASGTGCEVPNYDDSNALTHGLLSLGVLGLVALRWGGLFENKMPTFTGFAVTDVVHAIQKHDCLFRPMSYYKFNAYRRTMICHHAVDKLKLVHPGMRATAYTISTFVYTLAELYPELDGDVRYDTATYYHQYLLARDALTKIATGDLSYSVERL